MKNLLNQFQNIQNKAAQIRKTCKTNQLPLSILNGFNCKKVKEIYCRLTKHCEQHPDKTKTLWFQNELKLYFWILLVLSLLENKKIEQFNDQIWFKVKEIFPQKQLYTFKYQAKRILSLETKNLRTWNFEEESILNLVMKDPQMMNRWNQVARRFYFLSEQKYFRTGKQCREHWINHLDGSKKHGNWEKQQDQIILKYVLQEGKKWSNISKHFLPHRTEHMIKNRYKSLVTKFKKLQNVGEVRQGRYLLKQIIKNKFKKQSKSNQLVQQKQINELMIHKKEKDQQKVKTEQIQMNPEQQMLPEQHHMAEKVNGFTSLECQEHQINGNCQVITPATNNSPIGFIYNPFNGLDVSQYWNNYHSFLSQNQFPSSYSFGQINFSQ